MGLSESWLNLAHRKYLGVNPTKREASPSKQTFHTGVMDRYERPLSTEKQTKYEGRLPPPTPYTLVIIRWI